MVICAITAGLAVRHVAPESPAADSGLERDDVITAVDGQAVSDFDATIARLTRG